MSASVNFRKIFTQKNIRNIYFERIRDTRAIGLDRMRPLAYENILSEEVKLIYRKIVGGSFKFSRYKQKLISKGAGKFPRILSIPTVRDRLVLRGLCDFLQITFDKAVGELPQRKIDVLSRQLKSGRFQEYIKLDLQDFYGSIDHGILDSEISKRVKKREIRELISASVKTPTVSPLAGKKNSPVVTKGVPQGLSVSNLLAEIAIESIDSMFACREDICYLRYVDDILILVPEGKSIEVASDVIYALKAKLFDPHDPNVPGSKSKVGPLTDKFSYLGYQIEGDRLGVREETAQRFEAGIAGILTAYRHRLGVVTSTDEKQRAIRYARWYINLKITGCISEGRRKGWIFYFSQINDMSVLSRLQHTIEVLLARHSLSTEIRPKTLFKAFHEAKRKDKAGHAYIPNFDEFSLLQKRDALRIWYADDEVVAMSVSKVEQLFDRKIRRAVKELEVDLGHIS